MQADYIPLTVKNGDFYTAMNDTDNLKLVYVNPIGVNSGGVYEYEFFFSETPEIVWGDDWNEQCPSACEDTLPDPDTYSLVKRLKTVIPFFCAQENSCYSLQDMVDGIICVAHENIIDYDDYPEPYRIVFKFGESYEEVETKLASRSQLFYEGE